MKIGCFLQHLDILKHTNRITEVKKEESIEEFTGLVGYDAVWTVI
jgi:hypothetical protein